MGGRWARESDRVPMHKQRCFKRMQLKSWKVAENVGDSHPLPPSARWEPDTDCN